MRGHIALRFIETLEIYVSSVSKYDAVNDLCALIAENQRLRDALERCAVAAIATDDAQTIARSALDDTP